MKVLVTGGTGLVGSHTTAALRAGGHDVRLLVRRPERVSTTLAPHGAAVTDVHTGDVTDPVAVRAAVAGCDAVIHAASVFSYDPRDVAEIEAVNVRGTRNVLGAAVAAGCAPVVHVSSTVAFLPAREQPITEDSPLGDATSPYLRSKAASERVARQHQAAGGPVVITYPGAVTGPLDPHLQELNRVVVTALTYPVVPGITGAGLPVVDVRDVAAAHAAILDRRDRAHDRYLLAGEFVSWRRLVTVLGAVTGRHLRLAAAPGGVVAASARFADVLQPRLSHRLPVSAEAVSALILLSRVSFESRRAEEELGVRPRAVEASLRDTVRWLVDAGHVPPRKAGRPARAAASTA